MQCDDGYSAHSHWWLLPPLYLRFPVPGFLLSPNLFRMLGSSTYLTRLLRRPSILLPESVRLSFSSMRSPPQ